MRLPPLLLLCLLSVPEAEGRARPRVEWEGCLAPALPARRVEGLCARRYLADDGREVCFPARLGKELLAHRSPCLRVLGVEKIGAFPDLDGGKKEHWARFQAERVVLVSRALFPGRELLHRILFRIERVRETIGELLPRGEGGSALRFLLLGEGDPETPLGLLRVIGFVHVLGATGIHLYALFGAIEWLLRGVARAGFPQRPAVLASARPLAFGICAFAWALTGFRLGMLRPFLVILLRRALVPPTARWRPLAPLGLALAVDLSFASLRGDPLLEGPRAEGRILYALSVGGGLLALEGARRGRQSALPPLHAHVAMALGSWWPAALWEAFHTGLFAPWTPILSLVTIPLLVTFAYPLAIAGAALAGSGEAGMARALFAALAQGSDAFLFRFADALERLGGLAWCPVPALWVGGGLALVSLAKGSSRRFFLALVCVCLAVRLFTSSYEARPGAPTEVEQWDVAQGDAALVRTREGDLLIDAGAEKALAPDAWLRAFSKRGVRRLRFVALTHLDLDHAGGLLRLARLIPIERVVTSGAEWETERGARLRAWLRERGIRALSWEESAFPFPYLPPEKGAVARSKGNARMSAVAIPLPGGLLYANAGDAEGRTERRAMEWFARLAAGEKRELLLKASHHGSRFSSTAQALAGIRAKEVWVSVGAGNPYGHPTEAALRSLAAHAGRVRRTDREGTLRLRR